jgi:type II restriction/modification system DNA methylase subunit YeeA
LSPPLKWVFSDPDRLKPGKTRQALTEEAAAEFAKLAQRLRDRGHLAETVAHFINRLVFCMFAEDVDLLPNKMFKRMLEHAATRPDDFQALANDLFKAMQSGGRVGFEQVAWFNGGLFNDDGALVLDAEDIAITLKAARLDWAEVDPSILGTLFERGLDPDKRSQLGAHYTDREKIMMIVDPVIVRPWLAEWEAAKAEIATALDKAAATKNAGVRTKARDQATVAYRAFLDKLRAFRALDPACGSGNFLYLALLALKDIEHRVSIEAEALGLQREFPQVGPSAVKGVEINPYAAELARVSVWIGEIQWMRRNGFGVSDRPILKPLDNIECRDAIVNGDVEAPWPVADAIIGNPPFLGGKKIISVLGADYTKSMRKIYSGRLPAFTDLVAYWLEKSRAAVVANHDVRVGLVTTNSITGGSNLPVMQSIARDCRIFEAWSDQPWTVEGASVRVSIICFASAGTNTPRLLDGISTTTINPDLSSGELDITKALRLAQNRRVCFEGGQKHGPFEIDGATARAWLLAPSNPNKRPNSDVIRRFLNATDIARRMSDAWVIDFGDTMSEAEASLYELPFAYIEKHVRPVRLSSSLESHRRLWWRHHRTRPELRKALTGLTRYIATPVVSKHRVFSWLPMTYWPTNLVDAIARDDDASFGILHSRFHEMWALRLCTWLGVGNDPRYTPSTVFETFPFPGGLTPNTPVSAFAEDARAVKIAAAAKRLNELRETWLNPPELVRFEPEVVPNYPDRILAIDDNAAAVLKKRTLTNLYNERPTWLANAHADLDAAVAAAYGWPADISEEDALARLFQLNQERSKPNELLTD